MNRFLKYSLFLLFIILFCSCTHTLLDKSGKVVSVKYSEYRVGNNLYVYKVKVKGIDGTSFFNSFLFRTNTLYQIGDTIYVGEIYNHKIDTIDTIN